MNKNFRPIIFFLFLMSFLIIGCEQKEYPDFIKKTLELSGSNRSELESVIDSYTNNPSDSLKLKCAYFLIENMKYHKFDSPNEYFDDFFEQASKLEIKHSNDEQQIKRRIIIEKMLKKVKSEGDSVLVNKVDTQYDLRALDAEFIKKNIELSLKAWSEIPLGKRASFDDFCNYILPYRNGLEPVDIEDRAYLNKKYHWVLDSLKKGVALKKVVYQTIKSFDFKIMTNIRKKYPNTLSIRQVEKLRLGICEDGVNYFVQVFRSLGLIAASDFIDHWGNHHNLGHNWVYVKYGDDSEIIDAAINDETPKDLYATYRQVSIPKVFRKLFAPKIVNDEVIAKLDVTHEYIDTFSPVIPIQMNRFDKADFNLYIYDSEKEWFKVC